MTNTWEDEAARYVEMNEGRRSSVYFDSLGIPTIGIGFNLERADAKEKIRSVGAKYDDVMSGEPLTNRQIELLFGADLADAIIDLKQVFATFDEMPNAAKIVLVDMRFNLGPRRFRSFSRTIGAFKAWRFHAAAKWIESTLYARQVGNRAVRNVQMLRRLQNGAHDA